MDTVGREVKRLREERGWSQAKLAVEAGMSVSGVSMIENGKRNLSTATLEKLANALDVEVRNLFPLAETPLFQERPEEEREERRRDVMSDTFARLIDAWERIVEERASPVLSRSIWLFCHAAINDITLSADLVGKWGSGQLTEEEFSAIEDEYKADRAVWWALQDRLYEIARNALKHYEEASEEIQAAEVRDLREIQKGQEEIRAEIRRRTQELSA